MNKRHMNIRSDMNSKFKVKTIFSGDGIYTCSWLEEEYNQAEYLGIPLY